MTNDLVSIIMQSRNDGRFAEQSVKLKKPYLFVSGIYMALQAMSNSGDQTAGTVLFCLTVGHQTRRTVPDVCKLDRCIAPAIE